PQPRLARQLRQSAYPEIACISRQPRLLVEWLFYPPRNCALPPAEPSRFHRRDGVDRALRAWAETWGSTTVATDRCEIRGRPRPSQRTPPTSDKESLMNLPTPRWAHGSFLHRFYAFLERGW